MSEVHGFSTNDKPKNQREWENKGAYATLLLADEDELGIPKMEIQRVRFPQGGGKKGHFHKQKTEFFHFIKGKGKVIIDGIEYLIQPGAHFLIQPGQKHEFINTGNEPLEAIEIKRDNNPNDTYKV